MIYKAVSLNPSLELQLHESHCPVASLAHICLFYKFQCFGTFLASRNSVLNKNIVKFPVLKYITVLGKGDSKQISKSKVISYSDKYSEAGN